MNLTDHSIRRPVAVCMVMFGLIFFGINSYFSLPVSEMPNIDFPTLRVTANLPGADPETMASAVATPLEKQFSAIAGLNAMNSVNATGQTQITLQFDLSRELDAAALDVQAAITTAQGNLPSSMTTPPSFRKSNPADAPIYFLRLSSKSLPIYKVTEYAKTYLAQRLSMLPGVAEVIVYGDQTYAPRIQLDPDRLAAWGLGLEEVAAAVQSQNSNLPTGTLDGDRRMLTIRSRGQLMEAAAFAEQIVTYREGQPVRIGDLGQVLDASQYDKTSAFYNGEWSVNVAVKRQPGSNTIAVVDGIKAQLPAIRQSLPAAVEMENTYDRSVSIRESVDDVKLTLLIAVALTVLVVFLFLRDLRATLITSLALPSSLIGTFAAMNLCGFSLDNLSLMAITLAVGFVVDDAIVMLENIVRHQEMGKPPFQAALDGARQIGFTIISMSCSLTVVFVPILFMAGILGRVLAEFAATITLAIAVSGFVTLTLTPMLCSRFLSASKEAGKSEGGFFAWLERRYETSLRLALRHRLVTVAISVLILAGTFWLFGKVPAGFIPSSDSGQIQGSAQAEQGTSFLAMRERMLRLTELLREDESVKGVFTLIGVTGPNSATNEASVSVFTKPRHARPDHLNGEQVLANLRTRAEAIPDLKLFLSNPPAIRIGGRMSKSQYQFTLLSPSTDELYPAARQMENAMRGLPQLRDVGSDMLIDGPQVVLELDRDLATAAGVSAKTVELALQTAYAGREISNIYASTDTYKVIMELVPKFRRDAAMLGRLYVRSTGGDMVPLRGITKLQEGVGPVSVNHSGQLTSVTISFNVREGYALGDAVQAIYALARQDLPASVSYRFEGQATAFEESLRSVPFLLLVAVVVIYLILGVLYESFVHPFTILSGLPSAAFGGLLILLWFKMPLDLYGFVGLILLIGIVKKNAIMVIDFAVEAEHKGLDAREAIFKGCVIRFRPIMMTTLAAIAGIAPIALGYGAGGEARQPMGLVVSGGLCISQVVTLYLTPVLYTYLDQLQSWLRHDKAVAERVMAAEP